MARGTTDLFRECLRPGLEERFLKRIGLVREVFPAGRNKRMEWISIIRVASHFFYDRSEGFRTHHKYASVLKLDGRTPHVADEHLEVISSFKEGFERIKENCSLYPGMEAPILAVRS